MQREPADDRLPGARRDPDQPRPCPKPNASYGFVGELPETPHHGLGRTIHAVSLPGGSKGGHGGGPGVGTDIT
jgi:hypothetical protein